MPGPAVREQASANVVPQQNAAPLSLGPLMQEKASASVVPQRNMAPVISSPAVQEKASASVVPQQNMAPVSGPALEPQKEEVPALRKFRLNLLKSAHVFYNINSSRHF